jgi:hypothetical protein
MPVALYVRSRGGSGFLRGKFWNIAPCCWEEHRIAKQTDTNPGRTIKGETQGTMAPFVKAASCRGIASRDSLLHASRYGSHFTGGGAVCVT